MSERANRAISIGLVVMLIFGVLSSLIGTVLATAANGAGMPLSYLDGTPFTSYVIPGVILGVIVGGTQLLGAWAILAQWRSALLLAAVAGFGMLVWIFVEIAVIEEYSWLQALYFALGIAELAAVIALAGVAPRLVAPWMALGETHSR
jgi:hypothetical protein